MYKTEEQMSRLTTEKKMESILVPEARSRSIEREARIAVTLHVVPSHVLQRLPPALPYSNTLSHPAFTPHNALLSVFSFLSLCLSLFFSLSLSLSLSLSVSPSLPLSAARNPNSVSGPETMATE